MHAVQQLAQLLALQALWGSQGACLLANQPEQDRVEVTLAARASNMSGSLWSCLKVYRVKSALQSHTQSSDWGHQHPAARIVGLTCLPAGTPADPMPRGQGKGS